MGKVIFIGGVARITWKFEPEDGTTFPDSSAITVQKPDGTLVDPPPQVEQLSDDTFRADVVTDQAGVWNYEAVGTPTVVGVVVGSFSVFPSTLGESRHPDLVTLEDVRLARRGMPAVLDELVVALIGRASAAIARWTGRQFARDPEASDRWFPVNGYARSGEVPIDDLADVPEEVALVNGSSETVLDLDDIVVLPRNRPNGEPITYLWLPNTSLRFTQTLRVEGVWGFPFVPYNVREACIETVVEWLKADQAVTAPSPEMFEPGSPPQRGLPLKALDLLRPYKRMPVA